MTAWLARSSSPLGTTTQSRVVGEFLATGELPRIGGVVWERPISETAVFIGRPVSSPLSLAPKNPFLASDGAAGQIKEAGRALRVGETTRLAHRAIG